MSEQGHLYAARVKEWSEQNIQTWTSTDHVLRLFDRAFTLLWKHARLTISAVTLSAILDRAQFNAAACYLDVMYLKVDKNGICFDGLYQQISHLKKRDLTQGLQLMLTEFLTIVGVLTGEIVTPRLLEELSSVKSEFKFIVIEKKEEQEDAKRN